LIRLSSTRVDIRKQRLDTGKQKMGREGVMLKTETGRRNNSRWTWCKTLRRRLTPAEEMETLTLVLRVARTINNITTTTNNNNIKITTGRITGRTTADAVQTADKWTKV
jgi:hypothetical protein